MRGARFSSWPDEHRIAQCGGLNEALRNFACLLIFAASALRSQNQTPAHRRPLLSTRQSPRCAHRSLRAARPAHLDSTARSRAVGKPADINKQLPAGPTPSTSESHGASRTDRLPHAPDFCSVVSGPARSAHVLSSLRALRGVTMRVTLEAGFTTVRNVGAGRYADIALRDAINDG